MRGGESLIIYNLIGVQSREVTDHCLNSVDVLSYHWAILYEHTTQHSNILDCALDIC